MRLKKLEISGFKTFCEKVVLEFSPGISGVIGPNGCGKSNIVDAIRWVMGEQRIKALRGKKMDDVIFSGAENTAPVGMAEVTMTMVSDGQPFSGAYGECSELTIARRIFREGESEYYLNKVPCRLLDVKEFFMDTGVGARTYSLVEQNSVSTLVEAKPEERRQYIEEAAGIAKYKSRKEAALRKMEATRQNMLRLHDIMKEVKTQLNVVSRQAKRAELYRALKKEIKEAELSLALVNYADLIEKRAALEKDREILQGKETAIRTELKGREASFEELKVTVMQQEEMISQSREKIYEIKNVINMKEQTVEFSRKRVADLHAQKERNVAEIKTREDRLADIRNEVHTLTAQIETLQREIQDVQAAILASQKQLDELRKADSDLNRESDARKVAYIDIAAEKSKLKNMEANFVKTLEDINKRKERHLKEMEENAQRSDFLSQSWRDISEALGADEENREGLKTRQGSIITDLGEARERLRQVEDDIAGLKDQNGRKSARLASLQEFQDGYTWCSEGIKSIMTARKQGSLAGLAGDTFLGLVADHIDVPMEYEMAVEAVLGEKLQYVVVKNQEDGIRAIDYLKQSASGRGTFVPLGVRNYHLQSPQPKHLEATVRLLDRVQVHDDFKAILDNLLGDVLLIPNLKDGVSLWSQNGFRGSFVTPDGDIINSHGILTGGSHNKGERNLLANKREIGELKKEISRLRRDMEESEEDRIVAINMIAGSEEALQQVKTELHQLEIQINGRCKDLERFDDEMKRINQRRSIHEFDHETMVAAETETLEKMELVKHDQIVQEERELVITEVIAGLNIKRQEVKSELEKWEREYTATKVLLAASEEKMAAGQRNLTTLGMTQTALLREITEKQADQEKAIHQEAELAVNIAGETENLGSLYQEYQLLEKTLAEMNLRQQDKDGLLKDCEREVKEIKQSLERVTKEANEREIALREIDFQSDHLKNNIQERHYVDLGELVREFKGIEAGEKQATMENLEKARATVENFGEVNLLALSEYEQLKERHDFLTAQDADITASLQSLQRTIERINRISRTRFAETFEAVNLCFQEMFTRIFPGGKGSLYLTDSTEMLETGVEMDIQIPGKRTRNVSLLSGGEKSLAAIALILAIIQYRPTPFLVLDEVDAALDDANISLFNRLIQDIAKNSQIIMITHNKKTMEVAENLYGITMQNQGVSTLVSVNLN
ncbi:MAG: chromosome segregation protein SMC [Deltaproteobacteria bacterium]|nr:chromosome segregation protein SMC [Deltaproteobacteria bacterium]